MVKREFSKEKSCWKRWKKERTLQQRDDNVVRMSCNVRLFCVTFVLEGGFLVKQVVRFNFFYSLLVSFSSFIFSTGKKNIWVIGFNIYERITVSKNCKDAHLHWSFVVSVCFVDLFGEKLSKIGSSWDYIALFKPRVTTVSLPYSLQLCNKFRCVCESNFMSIYWTTHQRDRRPLSDV